jgi:hypothetical protein
MGLGAVAFLDKPVDPAARLAALAQSIDAGHIAPREPTG